jgi:YgiT-type zinc finger domain-containing protein
MECLFCKGRMESGRITHSVDLKHCVVVIKNVPALICAQCGEVWFSGVVTRRIEQILHEIEASSLTEIAIVHYSPLAA